MLPRRLTPLERWPNPIPNAARCGRFAAVCVVVLAACMLAASGGCTSAIVPPVDVYEMTLVDASDEAVRFDIDLEIENRSDDSITLREFRYTFETASGATFRGRRAALATLQAGRRQSFVLPVVLAHDEAVAAAEGEWTLTGRVHYLTPGEVARVLFDAGLRRPRAGFSGSGALPSMPELRALPAAPAASENPDDAAQP